MQPGCYIWSQRSFSLSTPKQPQTGDPKMAEDSHTKNQPPRTSDGALAPNNQHISVNVPPPFDKNSVACWFQVWESIFTLAKISSPATKFLHVLSNLPLEVVSQLTDDVVLSNNYDTFRDSLVQIFTRSKHELFDSLIIRTTLSLPSQLCI